MSKYPTYPVGSYVRMLTNVTWGEYTFQKGEKYLVVEGNKDQHRPRVRISDPELKTRSFYLDHTQVEKVIDIDPEEYFYDLVIGDDIAVYVETEEDAKKLLAWAHSKGLVWTGGKSFLGLTHFTSHKDIVYYLKEGYLSSLKYAKDTGSVIINFSQHKNRI